MPPLRCAPDGSESVPYEPRVRARCPRHGYSMGSLHIRVQLPHFVMFGNRGVTWSGTLSGV